MDLRDNILNVSFPLKQNEEDPFIFWFRQNRFITIHVVFTPVKRKHHFEINFGVLHNNQLRVLQKTNANKALRTFNTVVIAILIFLDRNPDTSLIFSASDKKRARFYQNRIIRFLPLIEEEFRIWGIFHFSDSDILKEPYKVHKHYDEIVIARVRRQTENHSKS